MQCVPLTMILKDPKPRQNQWCRLSHIVSSLLRTDLKVAAGSGSIRCPSKTTRSLSPSRTNANDDTPACQARIIPPFTARMVSFATSYPMSQPSTSQLFINILAPNIIFYTHIRGQSTGAVPPMALFVLHRFHELPRRVDTYAAPCTRTICVRSSAPANFARIYFIPSSMSAVNFRGGAAGAGPWSARQDKIGVGVDRPVIRPRNAGRRRAPQRWRYRATHHGAGPEWIRVRSLFSTRWLR